MVPTVLRVSSDRRVARAARWLSLLGALVGPAGLLAQDVNPYPPRVFATELLREWTFTDGVQGWVPMHHVSLAAEGGSLVVESGGGDPYLGVAVEANAPGYVVRLRARSTTAGKGQLFWTTDRYPQTSEEHSQRFEMVHDGQWQDYEAFLRPQGKLTSLRLDPGSSEGRVEIDRIALHRGEVQPLGIERVESSEREVRAIVKNGSDRPRTFRFEGEEVRIESGATVVVSRPLGGSAPVEAVTLRLESEGYPPIERSVVVFRPDAEAEWVEFGDEKIAVKVTADGTCARIERDGKLLAALAPIALDGPRLVTLHIVESSQGGVRLEGDGVKARLETVGGVVHVRIRSERELEGPVVRSFGELEQGLFAGLEYLGQGERSSSTLDIETEDHLRFAPDPLQVTLPLMACRTPAGLAAMTWRDMTLRPVFATPNFLDGTTEHRMALRGKEIEASLLVGEESLEGSVLWAVRSFGGLPPVPESPRAREAQVELCLKSLRGPISGDGGWGHCADERFPRRAYADVASTLWRLTGEIPELPGELVPGGAHVANDAIYLVTGRAGRWLEERRAEARQLARSQGADGSYAYRGPFRRGHFEDTASGICARPAMRLLEFAWLTGDEEALAAGLRTLEFMKRFRTPRGAQTWELSLHTPDVLASAYLVWAYVRGYELTGRREYLDLARQWAISGVPFVYLWDRYPVMRYATPPVYGATNYRAPLWIGLPVQWCGGVYAYALTLLAPHDPSFQWRHLARGILVAGQEMQYPDGPLVGCLPDVFELPRQERAGPSINPCALVSLQLVLEGQLDSLALARDSRYRVVAPFPVTIEGETAVIEGHKGVPYQIVVDGERVVDVRSEGVDRVPLGGSLNR